MNELEEKINKYAIGRLYFSPLFKKVDDKYYVVFHLLELIDGNKIKLLEDALLFDIKTLEFVKEVKLTKEKTIKNPKFSGLHNLDGYILKEFNSFKTNIVSKVKEKVDCSEDIILHNKKLISPKKFIDDNIDEILDTIYKELFSKISDPVTKGFNALFDTTFDDARKKYIKTKKLNDEAYKKIVLYTWPDFEFLIYED